MFPHTVGDQIRPGIQKNGPLHLVRPVIIMRQSAQAGLNAADNDRRVLVGLPEQITIDNGRVIRPFSHHAARRKRIRRAPFLGHRIVIHHRIHIARRH